MSFNTLIDWNSCSPEQQRELLMRPAISASESISRTVAEILENVKNNGDRALREYSAKFDKTEVGALRLTEEEIQQASSRLSDELKQAMQTAVRNIDTFHTAQILPPVDIETQPGVRCQQVDDAARRVITEAGYGKFFGHNTGHAIGIEVHEEPRFSPRDTTTLQPGMLLTVEPGIYLPGQGGVRIEDVVLVTPQGAEVLYAVPKTVLLTGEA